MKRIIPGYRAFLGEPIAFGLGEMPVCSTDDPAIHDFGPPEPEIAETFDEQPRAEIERQIAEQIQSRVDESYRAGYAAGREAAGRETSRAFQQVQEDFADIVKKIATARWQGWQEMEEFAVKLSLGIAKRIVQQTTEENEQLARTVAQQVIGRAVEAELVTLRLNPQDLVKLQASQGDFPPLAGGVEIRSDPRISRGGCIVETNMGEFDGRLETQLHTIYEKLMQEARAGNAGGLAQTEQAGG